MALVEAKGDAEQVEGLLLKLGWRGEHVEGRDLFVFGLDAVFDNRGQIAEQCLKALYPQPIVSLPGGSLAPSGLGAQCGRDDGSAGSLCLGLVVIVEENGSQQLAHVPLHVIGQHAKQDMSTHAIRQAVMDGAHMQIDGLETAKGSFYSRQALIGGDYLLAG